MNREIIIALIGYAALGLLGTLLNYLGEKYQKQILIDFGKAFKGTLFDLKQVLEARYASIATLLALLAALFGGCSRMPAEFLPDGLIKPRPMPVTMRFADNVPLMKRALAYSAAEDYRFATGGGVYVDFHDGGEVDFLIDDTVELGKCTKGLVAINGQVSDALFRAAVIHELGHKFGMGHLPDGVMAPNIDESNNCIDALALGLLCTGYRCVLPKPTCR